MSAVLEQNTSQGFPAEGRIFQPPQADMTKAQPRYLTIVGSFIEPQIATDRPWTKAGGMEVANPCLRYAKHFLRKGRITPLLRDTHDFMPYDWVKKMVDGEPTDNGWFRQFVPLDFKVPNLPPSRGTGMGNVPSPVGNMVGKVALPGDQIGWILDGNANIYDGMRRGAVELKSLKGLDYNPQLISGGIVVDPVIWEIQLAIFPDYPNLPVLLDDLHRLIDAAKIHTSIRETVDDFDESLTQFENYASATIQNSHAKMREIAANNDRGYVPRYTAMDLVLLEQLGMSRQDREIKQSVAVGGNAKLEGMFEQWLAVSLEEKQANAERMKRLGEPVEPVSDTSVPAPSINEQTMMAQPLIDETLVAGDAGQSGASGTSGASGQITNATSEGQEQMNVAMADTEPEFKCDYCSKPAASLAGKKSHERACEAAKAQE